MGAARSPSLWTGFERFSNQRETAEGYRSECDTEEEITEARTFWSSWRMADKVAGAGVAENF